jgi:hypothetical protein
MKKIEAVIFLLHLNAVHVGLERHGIVRCELHVCPGDACYYRPICAFEIQPSKAFAQYFTLGDVKMLRRQLAPNALDVDRALSSNDGLELLGFGWQPCRRSRSARTATNLKGSMMPSIFFTSSKRSGLVITSAPHANGSLKTMNRRKQARSRPVLLRILATSGRRRLLLRHIRALRYNLETEYGICFHRNRDQ